MHYGTIKACDIANGIGVRVSLFVSGCRNACPHCFQPETWDFTHGEAFTAQTQQKLLDLLAPSYIAGLTVLGGEPLEPENQAALLPFLKKVREIYPDKTIWIYTGNTYEQLCAPIGENPKATEYTAEILGIIDISGTTGISGSTGSITILPSLISYVPAGSKPFNRSAVI